MCATELFQEGPMLYSHGQLGLKMFQSVFVLLSAAQGIDRGSRYALTREKSCVELCFLFVCCVACMSYIRSKSSPQLHRY